MANKNKKRKDNNTKSVNNINSAKESKRRINTQSAFSISPKAILFDIVLWFVSAMILLLAIMEFSVNGTASGISFLISAIISNPFLNRVLRLKRVKISAGVQVMAVIFFAILGVLLTPAIPH